MLPLYVASGWALNTTIAEVLSKTLVEAFASRLAGGAAATGRAAVKRAMSPSASASCRRRTVVHPPPMWVLKAHENLLRAPLLGRHPAPPGESMAWNLSPAGVRDQPSLWV